MSLYFVSARTSKKSPHSCSAGRTATLKSRNKGLDQLCEATVSSRAKDTEETKSHKKSLAVRARNRAIIATRVARAKNTEERNHATRVWLWDAILKSHQRDVCNSDVCGALVLEWNGSGKARRGRTWQSRLRTSCRPSSTAESTR